MELTMGEIMFGCENPFLKNTSYVTYNPLAYK